MKLKPNPLLRSISSIKPRSSRTSRKNKRLIAPILQGLLGLALLGCTGHASATDLYWLGGGSGFDWDTSGNGGNWAFYDAGFFYSPTAPTSADGAIFGWLESPTTVNVTPGAAASGVRVIDGTATFNLQGNTLQIGTGLSVGDGYSGTLSVNGGIINAGYMNVGVGAGNAGEINLTDTTLNTSPSYSEVGYENASGTVNLGAGGVWNSGGAIYIGDTGGTGTVNLTAASSRLNGSLISFGYNGGQGSLSVSSEAIVTAQKFQENSGSGTMTIDNGTLVATGNESDFISGFDDGDVVISAGGLTIDTQAFAVGISSNLQGTGGLTKTGSGALTLSGYHSYTGTTSVLAGSLIAGSDYGLSGVSAISLASGTTLDASATGGQLVAGLSGSGSLIIGSGEFQINSNTDETFAGVISGSGNLLKGGSGKTTLSGTNTYLGGTTIDGANGASLSISSDANLGAVSGGLTLLSGSTIELTAGITSSRDVVVDSGSTIHTVTGTSIFTGVISGTGGLTKSGAGTLALNGINTYTADTHVTEGGISVNSNDSFGHDAGSIFLADGTTLTTTATFNTTRSIYVDGSAVNLNIQSGTTLTTAGTITGTAGIDKTGGGTLTLDSAPGQNTYLGDTRIFAGSLRAAGGTVFSASSNVILAGNLANLDLNGHDQVIGALSGVGSVLLGSGTLTTDTTFSTTLEGPISGTGGLVKSGTGTLTLLNTTSSYSGGTTVNSGGALIIADNSNLGATGGALTLDSGTLKLRSSPSIATSMARNVTLGAGGGTFDTNGRTLTLGNVISGDGNLTKEGGGTLVLGNAANSYTGGTVLNAGSIQISSNGALGNTSGTVTLEGGSLIVNGSVATARSFIGNGPLIKEGTGLLILSGTGSSYLGGTFVNQGKLRFANDSNLGLVGTEVTLNGGSISAVGIMSSNRGLNVMVDSQFEVISGIANWNGPIYGDPIYGDKILTKTGNGVLVARGFNSHKGFAVQQGTLQIADDINIGGIDSSVVLTGGTLRISTSTTITRDIRIGTGTLDTGSNNVSLSVQALTGDTYGTVNKTGSGSLTVLSSNKLGTFNVTAGSLKPASSNSLSSHQQIALQANGTLDISGTSATIKSLGGVAGANVNLGSNALTIGTSADQSGYFAGNISGTGSLVKTGFYTQTLAGTNTYSGGTTVSGGSLIFGSASAVPASGLILNQAYTGAGYAMDQAFLDSFNKPSSTGVIGIQVATSKPLSLVGFSSSASLGTDVSGGVTVSSTITPQGSTYRFSGGYGRINLSSDLTGSRNLQVDSLQLYLSGTNTLTNGITAGSGGVIVFENSTAIPVSGSLVAGSNGYVGTAQPLDQAFLNRFDKAATSGVIGMNADTSNPLDLTGFSAGASLGTVIGSNGITVSGLITPQGVNYRFGGVSSAPTGTLTVASNLTGSRGVDVGQINLALTGANSYSGPTTISNGTIRVAENSRLGTGKLVLNYGTYQPTASFASSREIEIIGYGFLSPDSGTTLTQNGNVTGGGNLYKYGAGTVILAGSNNSSSVTVDEGTLRFGSAGALASGASLNTYSGGIAELGGINRNVSNLYQFGGVVDLGGANLTVNSGDLYQGQITGDGALVKTSAGSLYIDQANTQTGGTVLQQGSTFVRNAAALGAGSLTLSGGNLINDTGATTLVLSNNASVTATSGINTGTATGSGLTLSGSLSGSGNITKTGAGVMALTGASTHSGTITVQAGTLKLTGSTASKLVANTSTSIITGDGTTTGKLTVSNGGMVSPGNSPGTLHVGQVEFGVSGVYDWEISSVSSYDRIASAGTIDITATTLNPFVIRLQTLDAFNNDGILAGFDMASSYTWILASGLSTNGFNAAKFSLDFDSFYNPANPSLFSIAQQGNSIVIQYNAALIPEPSSLLIVLSAAGVCFVRRRRGY